MAKTKIKRSPFNQATLGSPDIAGVTYNGRAGAVKKLEVGPEIRILPNATTPQTSAFTANSSPVAVNPGTSLMLYNNSSSVAWVTMYQAAVNVSPVAPSAFANAVALPPNAYTRLNMGENDTISTSAATVGIYIIEDDTTFALNQT